MAASDAQALPSRLAGQFAQTAYSRPLRRYQQLAVDAFERARAAGRRRAYFVLPPGAGKTVVGLELARRLGANTLVLCPNTAVQSQWLGQWLDFQPPCVPAGSEPDLGAPLTALTYQAICTFNTDDASLDDAAVALWREALRAESGLSPDQAAAEIERLAATGNAQYRAELARFRARARTLVARAARLDAERDELLALLHPNGRRLIETMQRSGPWTLVLDECHHLLEMWGHLVGALIDELGGDEVFVVGLTATPPADMDAREAALYQDLFGQADLDVATPALVKEGILAPYQELAYLTRPFEHEASYIAAQHARFERLTTRLLDADFGSLSLVAWLHRRVRERRSADGAQVSWGRFEQDEPALAQAALRFFSHYHLALPADARLGERHRRPPAADDWVALIEDYCLGCLKASADPRDAAAWQEIRQALPALGYVLTQQGVRSYVSPVDRVLSLSASKAAAAVQILAAEREVLGDHLRALVLCDYERAGREVLARLRGVLDPQAGSAALLLHILLGDPAAAALNPILVTGRTVACSRACAVDLGAWLEAQVPELRGAVATAPLVEAGEGEAGALSWEDLVVVRPSHAWWQPRHYVPLLTAYFEAGYTRCLVGTRGLLGEGWDARRVNVLVDLTAASTSTAVHQMRGRSLRLDPLLPHKVASNWDVVCVAPEHPKGAADYARFVRKHRHYYAPTPEGEIESGVSHVHPDLSPYGPPPAAGFGAINQGMLGRARDRAAARERWQIGTPYANREAHTVRVHFARSPGLPTRRLRRHAGGPERRPALQLALTAVGAVAAYAALAGLAGALGHPGQQGWLGNPPAAGLAAALAVAALGLAWMARSLVQPLSRLGPSDALEDFAAAVAGALRETGGAGPALGAGAVRLAAQRDGYYRCSLAGATEAESERFADCLDELLAPLSTPRYLVPRYVAAPPASAAAALWRLARQALPGPPTGQAVYHAVPAYFAANRRRVEAFRRAWNRHVGPGDVLPATDPRARAVLELQRGEDPFGVTTQLRTLWS